MKTTAFEVECSPSGGGSTGEMDSIRGGSTVKGSTRAGWNWLVSVVAAIALTTAPAGAQGPNDDFDGNGHVNTIDYLFFQICLTVSGPGNPAEFQECHEAFDVAADQDIDLADFASFQNARGHLPFPLKDATGNTLTVTSTIPYSGRQTCGDCHDVNHISNGLVFQQGRTDVAANIIMADDFFDDGRWWVRSAGMYGRWSAGGGGLNRRTAGKSNTSPSDFDLSAFSWAYNCGGCHVGGGGVEFDRDGQRLWEASTGQFGYELLGLTPEDVALDGDYAAYDPQTGAVGLSPWDATGVAGPECLHCHRATRTWVGGQTGQDMQREWRAAVLATNERLVDGGGNPIPAFASAGTAGQGWFSTLDTTADPPVLQIDYSVGVANGSLLEGDGGALSVPQVTLTAPPRDRACWGCHLPGGFQGKRGTVWFDQRDIHYRKFTNHNDEDPANDISDDSATVCNYCHQNTIDHNFFKGDSPYAQFRNDLDWADFRSCRDCHLHDSPVRHPDAPDVAGGADTVLVHFAGEETTGPMARLSCQACHVPHALERAIIVTDRSVSGNDIFYFTDEFLSANAIDPTDPDRSTWYPALVPKVDSDGVVRHFPQKLEIAIYWADWDRAGTMDDFSDDTVRPIILWRIRDVTNNQPLPVVTDDNDDGKLEVNRPEEMLAYMQALKGNDHFGNAVAMNPVLVKGRNVWYEDPQSPGGVASFDAEASGLPIQTFEIFGLDHNVLSKDQAWGSQPTQQEGCATCHNPDSPVFDRRILVDPFGPDGEPVYEVVRAMTGLNPPE